MVWWQNNLRKIGQHPPPSKRLNKAIPYPGTKSYYSKPKVLSCKNQGTLGAGWPLLNRHLSSPSLQHSPPSKMLHYSIHLFQNGALLQYHHQYNSETQEGKEAKDTRLGRHANTSAAVFGPLWEQKRKPTTKMCNATVNMVVSCILCFPISHTYTPTDWYMLTGQVKIRTQTHPLLKKKVRKKRQKKKSFSIWRFQNLNTCHSPHTTCLTEVDKLKARVFHYAEDRIKIKKRKPHKKEKQNDSDVLVYTRYGNTYKLSKLWSEKSCYQATVKRVLWDLEILCLL